MMLARQEKTAYYLVLIKLLAFWVSPGEVAFEVFLLRGEMIL